MASKSKSKRIKKIAQSSNDAFVVRSDRGNRVLYGPMTPHEEMMLEKQLFTKSVRTDYGQSVDIRIPHGYHAQVRKSWEMYESDRLFKYLVDRCTDFGANGSEWEVPLMVTGGFWQKFLENIKGSKSIFKKAEREKRVWDTWSARINSNVSNVLPGIDEINKWMIKHFQLCGMIPLEWEWGTMEIDKVKYNLPVQMTAHNSLSIVLDRENSRFMHEEVWLKISQAQKRILERNKTLNQVMSFPLIGSGDWFRLNLMGQNGKTKREAFVIKYNWSPGDNTTLVTARTASVGQGLYPSPPFVGLYEVLMLRRSLCAADLAILDGVVHFIIDWSIGNDAKDADGNLVNQPLPEKKDASGKIVQKSSVDLAKESITADTKGAVMQLFHPYYIVPKIMLPDVKSLISADKYIQSIIEMFLAFGILISPPRTSLDFGKINMANFEEMLENMRQRHIKRFWESLCEQIVRRNPDTLTTVPNLVFNPLNTKDEAFRNGLLSLAKIGKISTGRLLKAFGADEQIEVRELARELVSGEKAIYDASVPVSFKQDVVKKSGKEVTSEVSSTKQPGRPKKEEQEVEEE